jgi:geranylgeranyl diphosphate synthase type II
MKKTEIRGQRSEISDQKAEIQETPETKASAIPQERSERERLRSIAEAYVAKHHIAPPLTMEELRDHAAEISNLAGTNGHYTDFMIVLVSNAAWREAIASIPYNRRILLLPQCIRTKSDCPAGMDELGLLCEQCGKCPTGDMQAEAEKLGYSVLIAEGTTAVTKLIQNGKADAIIGVSCLAVLEKAFPHMAANAIPGIAIPLVRNGCERTGVDQDWVYEAIRLRSSGEWSGHADIDELRSRVDAWFQMDSLRAALRTDGSRTVEAGISWLYRSGKRWRPLLATCVFKALAGTGNAPMPELIKTIAVATECFHKASLVHDDIEDADDFRYGDMTLHRQHGIPIALNVGDFLIGEGYRLIGDCGATHQQIARMLTVAAEGHHNLCLGQGEELFWLKDPSPPSSSKVLDVFRLKTAPAFEVALRLGAIAGGSDDDLCSILKSFSESLGIAYQIRDDIEDFHDTGTDAGNPIRPVFPLAVAFEAATETERQIIDLAWRNGLRRDSDKEQVDLIAGLSEAKAWRLFEEYKSRSLRAVNELDNVHLKNLLRKVAARILNR